MARRWSWGRKTTAVTREVAAATAYQAASVRRWGRRNREGAKRRAGTRSRAATVRKIALSAASDTMNCTADLQEMSTMWNHGWPQGEVTAVACQRDLGHSTLATTVAVT